MRKTDIKFTVYGNTPKEVDRKADAKLREYLGYPIGRALPDYEISIEPYIRLLSGQVMTWEGTVEAEGVRIW